ncbi:hypothetical protein KSP40_PGU011712 [Platanthera guangdongensis]|uniref:DUF2470 domain-containing protein n=1 Tax=Platanthera guangdongensis TaxID=2320717 RepID=A0ABR2MKE8_9ASPA
MHSSSLLPVSSHIALPNFFVPNLPRRPFQIQTEISKFSSHHFSGIQCSALSVPIHTSKFNSKTSPAEVSRTIMELSSTGTLSAISSDGYPLGIGARFVVDAQGAPVLCLNEPRKLFAPGGSSSFHVQLEQSRLRMSQCTLLGNLDKLHDMLILKKLCTSWEKKFGEQVDEGLLYVIKVDRILLIEDFKEDTVWVTPKDYLNAEPDPLRNCAEKIVCEMDTKHAEDILRICNVYVDSQFQVTDAKLIWVDRLGFDLYIYSKDETCTVRIPFPREVSNEKAAKSSFNSMFHLAWEMEKGCVVKDFDKVKVLRVVR